LVQDRLFQLAQRLGRLDPELVHERPSRLLIDLERLGLSTGAVKREHQLTAKAFAEGVLAHQDLELGNELGVAAEREVELDPLFQRRQPELLEPPPLKVHE
jgi:hypothetical protein